MRGENGKRESRKRGKVKSIGRGGEGGGTRARKKVRKKCRQKVAENGGTKGLQNAPRIKHLLCLVTWSVGVNVGYIVKS